MTPFYVMFLWDNPDLNNKTIEFLIFHLGVRHRSCPLRAENVSFDTRKATRKVCKWVRNIHFLLNVTFDYFILGNLVVLGLIINWMQSKMDRATSQSIWRWMEWRMTASLNTYLYVSLLIKEFWLGKKLSLFIYNEQLEHNQNTNLWQDTDVLLYTSYRTVELDLPENLQYISLLCLFFHPLNRAV